MDQATTGAARASAGSPESGSIEAAAALGAVTSIATAAFSIVRSKITAVVLGPGGIGMTAEILQVTALFNAPAAMFTGPAFVAAVAQARSAGDDGRISRLYRGALSGALLLSAAGGIASVLAGRVLLPDPWGRSAWPLAALSAVGALFGSLGAVPAQRMVAHALLRSLAIASVLAAAVQTALVTGGTLWLGLLGQFLAIAVGPAAALAVTIAVGARADPRLSWRPSWSFDREFMLLAAKMGTTGLVASMGLQCALVAIRGALDRAGGPELNGHFQAAWTIGSVYFGLVLTALSNYSFPRYAAARDASGLTAEVATAGRFVLRAAPPLVLMVVAARQVVVHRLYTASFDPAARLLAFMLVGDLAKGVLWVQHGALLARVRLRAYLAVELAGVALFAGLSLALVPHLGLDGVGWAYVAAYVVLVPVSTVALRLTMGVSLGRGAFVSGALSTAMVGAAAWATSRWPVAQLASAALAVAWSWRAGLLSDAAAKVRAKLRPRRPPPLESRP